MSNLLNKDYNKKVFDDLLDYDPEEIIYTVSDNSIVHVINKSFFSKFSSSYILGLVDKFWPVSLLISLLEVIAGIAGLLTICLYNEDYDKIYNTEDSKLISNTAFYGCGVLTVSGFILLYSLITDKPRYTLLYIIISTFLCVYIFLLACVKMRYAIDIIETGTYDYTVGQKPNSNSPYLNTASVIAIATLSASVIHFFGAVIVFTYYNLKYIHHHK